MGYYSDLEIHEMPLFRLTFLAVISFGASYLSGQVPVSPSGAAARRINAADYQGSEPGVRITKAMAELPPEGGIIDAKSFAGTQAMTSVVHLNKVGVTVLFGCATWTLSGAK